MTVYILFAAAALLLFGLIFMIWRLWNNYTRISPEDEEHERNIATLNDAQANRVSDQQLIRNIDTDTGWQIMVRRGLQGGRRSRSTRPTRPPRTRSRD